MRRDTVLARDLAHPLEVTLREYDGEGSQKRILPSGISLLHQASEVALKDADGLRHNAPYFRLDRSIAPVGAISDAQAAHAAVQAFHPTKVGAWQAVAIAHIGSGCGRHHQSGVCDSAREWPDMLDRFPSRHPRIAFVTRTGVKRDPPHRGL